MADDLEGQVGAEGQGDVQPPEATAPQPIADWKSQLPDELKAEKSLESVKDLPTLVKNYVEAQKMIGGSVRLPKADAPPEEKQKAIKEIMTKLGAPESAEGYDFSMPQLPEGANWDDKQVSSFKEFAASMGLTKDQAHGLAAWWASMQTEQAREFSNALVVATDQLHKEWGPFADRNLVLARAGFEYYAGDDYETLNELFTKTGLINHPAAVKMFHRVGMTLPEDKFVEGQIAGALTPEMIEKKMSDMRNDLKGPYMNADHPDHKKAVQEFQTLVVANEQSRRGRVR